MDAQSANREGTSRGIRRALLGQLALVLLVSLAACDQTSDPNSPTTVPSDPPTSTTSSAPSTTTSLVTTTDAPTTSTTLDPAGQILQTWEAFWEAWATVRASEDLDPTPLVEVTDPEMARSVVAALELLRGQSGNPVETDVLTHGKVTLLEAGEATVEDCVLFFPSWAEAVGVWYEGDLREVGSGWVVTGWRVRTSTGCVPEGMAAAAIAGYESYYTAAEEFWDPPNPQHPMLADVLTEPRLSNVIALLEDHMTRGVAFRSHPTIHPEVIEVRSPTELVILDCYEPDPADGLYDLSTGQRLPDEPTVREGQRNLRSAVMVLDNGVWKSADFQGQVDFACDIAPTERGLPSI